MSTNVNGNTEIETVNNSYLRVLRTVQNKSFALTDLGNAERFVDQHGVNVHYIKELDKWVIWNGVYWAIDNSFEVERLAKVTIRSIYKDAQYSTDEISKHAKRSEAHSKIQAMLHCVKTENGIAIPLSRFDQNPFLLCVKNGVINLKTEDLLPHNRNDLITKHLDIVYDPNAKCPLWVKFLKEVLSDDLTAFVQRMVGYFLTGDVSEQKCFFLYGSGRNGKTTFAEVIRALLVPFTVRLPVDTLIQKNQTSIPNDVAMLKGARLAITSEIPSNARLNESRFKDLTGSDSLSARFLHKEYFQFDPTHKLLMIGNHKPIIADTGESVWRRFALIHFANQIENVDPALTQKLLGELSGILAWGVRGGIDWQIDGIQYPQTIIEQTNEYREESDLLARFIEDCIDTDDWSETTKTDVYQKFGNWCDLNGIHQISSIALNRQLLARGWKEKRTNKSRNWVGVRLNR